jgi:hypothetical protein
MDSRSSPIETPPEHRLLGRIGGEFKGSLVGGAGLLSVAHLAQQVRTRGVEEVVPIQGV